MMTFRMLDFVPGKNEVQQWNPLQVLADGTMIFFVLIRRKRKMFGLTVSQGSDETQLHKQKHAMIQHLYIQDLIRIVYPSSFGGVNQPVGQFLRVRNQEVRIRDSYRSSRGSVQVI